MPSIQPWTPWGAPADDWSRETAARMFAEGVAPGAIISKLEAYGCGVFAAQSLIRDLQAAKRGSGAPSKIVEVREAYGSDFYVYSGEKLVRVCPSIGMAREVAAGL